MKQLKPVAITTTLLIASLALTAQQPFTIKGHFTDTAKEGGKITLSYFNGTKKIYTSEIVKQGTFQLSGTVAQPTKVSLTMSFPKSQPMRLGGPLYDNTSFYIGEETVLLEGAWLATANIRTNSKAQQDYLALKAFTMPLEQNKDDAFQKSIQAAIAKDTAAVTRSRKTIANCEHAIDSAEIIFAKTNPRSFVSLDLVKDRVTAQALAEDKDNIAALFNNLADTLKNSVIGKQIARQFALADKLSPGKPSIDFTMNDTIGKPVTLSSFRGKYVLLDFWASWCVPCRAENKNVVKAYHQFKNKNFTVVSVSLEKEGDQKAWLDAIHKDGLAWTNLADFNFGNNKAATAYGVKSIPMNFLIDPKGNIAALHLRGETLLKKLEQVLNN